MRRCASAARHGGVAAERRAVGDRSSASKIAAGLANTELVVIAGLAKSKSEAFRLIEQGGITINDVAVTDPRGLVTLDQALAIGSRFKGRRA